MTLPQEKEIKTDGLIVTDPAVEQIRALMKERNLTEHALRVYVAGRSCSGLQYGLALEGEPRDNDIRYSFDDVALVIDPVSFEYMQGATIDYIQTSSGEGFHINNPNFSSPCCDTSGSACGSCG